MTEEDELWVDDKLGRKADAQHLLEVLLNRYEAKKAAGIGSYILNIDAAWGEGKTYFLRNFRQQLKAEGYGVAYVNAWEDDHTDDPLTAVLVAIENELKPHVPRTSVNRRPKRTPYRRAKGTPFVEQRDGYDGRFVRAGCGVGRA